MIHIKVYFGLDKRLASISPNHSYTDLMIDGNSIFFYSSRRINGDSEQTLDGYDIFDLRYNETVHNVSRVQVPTSEVEASLNQVNLLVLLVRAISKPNLSGDGIIQSLRSLGYDLTDIKIVRNYITDGLHIFLKSDDKREVTLEQLLVYIE